MTTAAAHLRTLQDAVINFGLAAAEKIKNLSIRDLENLLPVEFVTRQNLVLMLSNNTGIPYYELDAQSDELLNTFKKTIAKTSDLAKMASIEPELLMIILKNLKLSEIEAVCKVDGVLTKICIKKKIFSRIFIERNGTKALEEYYDRHPRDSWPFHTNTMAILRSFELARFIMHNFTRTDIPSMVNVHLIVDDSVYIRIHDYRTKAISTSSFGGNFNRLFMQIYMNMEKPYEYDEIHDESDVSNKISYHMTKLLFKEEEHKYRYERFSRNNPEIITNVSIADLESALYILFTYFSAKILSIQNGYEVYDQKISYIECEVCANVSQNICTCCNAIVCSEQCSSKLHE